MPWLFNQEDNYGDAQQSHCSEQNIVAPTGYQSKHIQFQLKSNDAA
jgi:hypothetical protein